MSAERYSANWQDEGDSAARYRALWVLEPDARVAEVVSRAAFTYVVGRAIGGAGGV